MTAGSPEVAKPAQAQRTGRLSKSLHAIGRAKSSEAIEQILKEEQTRVMVGSPATQDPVLGFLGSEAKRSDACKDQAEGEATPVANIHGAPLVSFLESSSRGSDLDRAEASAGAEDADHGEPPAAAAKRPCLEPEQIYFASQQRHIRDGLATDAHFERVRAKGLERISQQQKKITQGSAVNASEGRASVEDGKEMETAVGAVVSRTKPLKRLRRVSEAPDTLPTPQRIDELQQQIHSLGEDALEKVFGYLGAEAKSDDCRRQNFI